MDFGLTKASGELTKVFTPRFEYPSHTIRGLTHQNDFSLQIVTDLSEKVHYGVKDATYFFHNDYSYRSVADDLLWPHFQAKHIDLILVGVIRQKFGEDVGPVLARDMNYSLYKSIENDLLKLRGLSIDFWFREVE